MNEKKKSRREWVKTVAIVFLSVMLVLTFFSNTIMNYSLPQVAAQYIVSGSITSKVRVNGTVEVGDLYTLTAKESRKIASVKVYVGQEVSEGDLICTMEPGDSTEMEGARADVEAAQRAYDMALLDTSLSATVRKNAGTIESMDTYMTRISNAQSAIEKASKDVESAQKKVDDLQNQYETIGTQISSLPSSTADIKAETAAVNTAKTNKYNAELALTQAQNQLDAVSSQLAYDQSLLTEKTAQKTEMSTNGEDTTAIEAEIATLEADIATLSTQKTTLQQTVITCQTNVNNTSLAYEQAQTALANKIASGDTSGTAATLQASQNDVAVKLASAKTDLMGKQSALSDAQDALSQVSKDIADAIHLYDLKVALTNAQSRVDKIAETAGATEIYSPISGTIASVAVSSGNMIYNGDAVVTIQRAGDAYTMKVSVSVDQAKKISVGDVAEPTNSWWYSGVGGEVTSIKPDPSNPQKSRLITMTLTGDLIDGQSLSMEIGSRSANYDTIVPNSAIHEDNNGKFILIVESKSSPLGNRYYATRYDVQVVASDDIQSAVTGALYGYEYVITTSTKPLKPGDMIRLSDAY